MDEFVSDSIFCADRSTIAGSGIGSASSSFAIASRILSSTRTPSLVCPTKIDKFTVADNVNGNSVLTYKVGLLNADEAAAAGQSFERANNSGYLYNNYNNWLMTPWGYYNSRFKSTLIDADGDINDGYVYVDTLGIRPVISLDKDLKVVGDGSWNNPYIVE